MNDLAKGTARVAAALSEQERRRDGPPIVEIPREGSMRAAVALRSPSAKALTAPSMAEAAAGTVMRR